MKITSSASETTDSPLQGTKSQLEIWQPETLVKLDKLQDVGYENQPNNYILVHVIWRSERPIQGKRPCRFIVSDNTGHIMASLFLNSRQFATSNLYRRLKPFNGVLKIKNFELVKDTLENYRILRHQSVSLKLSSSTLDTIEVEPNDPLYRQVDSSSFIRYLPFEFTDLNQIDRCDINAVVDIFGTVKEIFGVSSSKSNQDLHFQRIRFSSLSPAEIHTGSDDEFEMEVTLFEEMIGTIERPYAVYALLNLKVNYYDATKTKSLKTTRRSIAVEITQENMQDKLQSKYHNHKLAASFTNEGNNAQTSSSRYIVPPIKFSSAQQTSGPLKRHMPSSHSVSQKKQKKHETASQPSTSQDQNENSVGIEEDFERIENKIPKKTYNFDETYVPLNVVVVPATTFKGGKINAYTMRSSPRGIALIINNYYFPPRKDFLREGSNHDVVYLLKFLKSCNFDVVIRDNVESQDLPSVLNSFKARANKNVDACFVAVMSHGMLGAVEMADGKMVPLHNDIIYQFDDVNFPLFKGKPKIFLVQACQNIPTIPTDETGVDSIPSMEPVFRQVKKLELIDCIVCHATISEHFAYRDIFLGSHFVYVLVDTLMDHAHDHDLMTILNAVHKRLQKSKVGEHKTSINTEIKNYGFAKLLYFNPGL